MIFSIWLLFFCAGLCAQSRLEVQGENIKKSTSEPNSMGYKPVVLVHGVLDTKARLETLAQTIRDNHPGTEVTIVDLYTGLKSFLPLWDQIPKFRAVVEEISDKSPDGIHMVGISQGNLICRGILETSNKHKVDTFVSVVGPQLGVYGLKVISQVPFYQWVRSHLYKLFYSYTWEWFSVAELWRDPYHLDLYKMENNFLPILNNEIIHPQAEMFKENFIKIKKMVLIGGSDDEIITPWQSSQFAFYNTSGNIVPMQEQEVFVNDTFGLKTLADRDGIDIYTVPGIGHADFQNNVDFIKEYVLPYLT